MKRLEVDRAMVRRLLAEQFPEWCDLDIEPVVRDGRDNRTFRLGPAMLIRLPTAQCYALQVEKEHRWLPELAPTLPLPIPVPLAMGEPGGGYPWKWSIYRWLEGEPAAIGRVDDRNDFAKMLGQFLVALQRADSTGGPAPGPHNFFRGGPLAIYEGEARDAISSLEEVIRAGEAISVWLSALKTEWEGAPVWVHGDMSPTNLLVSGGRLSGAIDFGCMGVGDPACDLTIAWTFFSGKSRETFREPLRFDNATWTRARGWALWKAAITLRKTDKSQVALYEGTRRVIEDLLVEHRRAA